MQKRKLKIHCETCDEEFEIISTCVDFPVCCPFCGSALEAEYEDDEDDEDDY